MPTSAFPLSTTLTALSTARVPAAAKGTLVGLEHATFAAASMAGPQLGAAALAAAGLPGVAGGAAAVYAALLAAWWAGAGAAGGEGRSE